MPGPIKPKEVMSKKIASIPEEVFEIMNDLIIQSWNGSAAVVLAEEAATKIAKALKITSNKVFERNLLDIEDAYRKAGWKVSYEKSAYGENCEPYFHFQK